MTYLRNVNVRWGSIDTHDLVQMYFEDDELERFGLRAGDVLVCEGGEPGRTSVWDGSIPELKYQKALHRVRFTVPFVPQFLVYFLQSLANTGEWANQFNGATIKHLTREMFVELLIPFPNIETQRQIVDKMEAERMLVESNRKLIEIFEAKIKAKLDEIWGTAEEPVKENEAQDVQVAHEIGDSMA